MSEKEVIDVACGGRMFYFQKSHPKVLYVDKNSWDKGCISQQMNFSVEPDMIADFRDLPFDDESFNLVVFDPPHVSGISMKSIIGKKYGGLDKDTWKTDLLSGFNECWRILRPGGTMIFKWNEVQVSIREVLDIFPITPLFGHTTAKSGKTKWMCFYKEQGVCR